MKRTRRRAIFLPEIVSFLPIIAAIATVSAQVTIHVLRFERRTSREVVAGAKLADLTRRIGLDAEAAQTATLKSTPDGAELVFAPPQNTSAPATGERSDVNGVVYRISGHRITRTQQFKNGLPVACSWTIEQTTVRFEIESLGNRPRLVWIIAASPALNEQGPLVERSCAAAVRVGTGGAS